MLILKANYKWLRSVLIAVLPLWLIACGKNDGASPSAAAAPDLSQQKQASVIVRIGIAGPLTGSQAHLGKDNEYGARLAIEDLNAQHLSMGKRRIIFKLVSEDDAASPLQATIAAQHLVDVQVAAVVGHWNSGTSIPASRIYANAGIPQITPSTTNPLYTHQGFKTAFRLIANDVVQAKALAVFAMEQLGAQRIGIIDDRTAAGKGQADAFETAIQALGGRIVAREYTTDHATDFRSILTSLKSKKLDLVFYGGMDTQSGPLLKQMRALAMTPLFLGADGSQTPQFIKLSGSSSEGAYASSPRPPTDKLPSLTDFNKRFKRRFNTDVEIYAPYAYDATMIIGEAVQKAQSVDPAQLLTVLSAMDYAGITGRIRFDPFGDIRNGVITVYQVKDGRWMPFKTTQGNDI